VFEDGAGDRIRTGDINLGKVALYQLSYSRTRGNSTIVALQGPIVKAKAALSSNLSGTVSKMTPIKTSAKCSLKMWKQDRPGNVLDACITLKINDLKNCHQILP
jgi:hypothetical protein